MDDPLALVGKIVDDCKVTRKLGEGATGVVYLAQHAKLATDYAIQFLRPALLDDSSVSRFYRNAQQLSRLDHPAIVSVRNVGEAHGYHFIRREFFLGRTLEEMVRERKIEPLLGAKWMKTIAEALAVVHAKSVIHNGVEPANIIVTPKGEPKLLGFGRAAAFGTPPQPRVEGVASFESPEQATGRVTDARSDIFSLGATFYFAITGVEGFRGKTSEETIEKVATYTPESPLLYAPECPESLAEVIATSFKKRKSDRFQNAGALVEALDKVTPQREPDLGELIASAKPGHMPARRPLPPGADARPLLVLMDKPVFAVVISMCSSIATFWAPSLKDALASMAGNSFLGVVALSPPDESGAAKKVIDAARAKDPNVFTIYHGWDYRLEVSGPRAVRCGADLLVVGGMDMNELLHLVVAGLSLKGKGKMPPPAVGWYQAILDELCPKSPFRTIAATLRQQNALPNEIE